MAEENEEWRPVVGFEGLYECSSLGNVRSVDRKNRKFCKGCVLKQRKSTNGYMVVTLWKNNRKKLCTVHRLIIKSFIPNPNNLPECNHKNECKTDNRVENLEWCDHKYNNNYGTKNKRQSEKKQKRVLQYSLDGDFIKEWPSLISVQNELGYNRGSLSNCCLNKTKTAYDYVWKYAS